MQGRNKRKNLFPVRLKLFCGALHYTPVLDTLATNGLDTTSEFRYLRGVFPKSNNGTKLVTEQYLKNEINPLDLFFFETCLSIKRL